MTDVDDAIAKYRARVQAEVKLAESDLDELEDHLRELTEELRTAGMSAAESVAEAARRLGDPRKLAREHARVRSPFGAPLSAGRTWSASIMFAVLLTLWTLNLAAADGPPVRVRAWLLLGAFVLIAIALAARITWARAVVLGATVHFITLSLLDSLFIPFPPNPFPWLAELGVLAFVIPWRRKEISPAAIGLALQVWAWRSASSLFFQSMDAYETTAMIAQVCAAAACIGAVRRARWSAIASAVSALALFSLVGDLFVSRSELHVEEQVHLFATVGSGALAASVAALLGWRTTGSLVGKFQRAAKRSAI